MLNARSARRPLLAPALLGVPLLLGALAACAPTQPIVQVPIFSVQSVRATSVQLPGLFGFGGSGPATLSLSLSLLVHNPNPLPLRVSNIAGRFVLDGRDVGTFDLPDVALPAGGDAVQRADLVLPLTLDAAASALRIARGQSASYRLDGSFTADLGLLGRPTFGPFTLVQGVIRQPAILP